MLVGPLTDADVEYFVEAGFVRLDGAFTAQQAAAAVDAILEEAGVAPSPPWPQPVVRLAGSVHPSVVETITTPRLSAAIDQLLGADRWEPRTDGFGTFPIRLPSERDPGDAGWHIDSSFETPAGYRVNLASRGRALLLLMLFTDVGPDDAPTRIRVGSHTHVARGLRDAGDAVAFTMHEHAADTAELPVVHAVGAAGTVYLCHPFVVHAATWPHRGSGPRVVGQPSIHHPEGIDEGGFDYDIPPDSPVKRAVRVALGRPIR